jgi:hypothetical protein
MTIRDPSDLKLKERQKQKQRGAKTARRKGTSAGGAFHKTRVFASFLLPLLESLALLVKSQTRLANGKFSQFFFGFPALFA